MVGVETSLCNIKHSVLKLQETEQFPEMCINNWTKNEFNSSKGGASPLSHRHKNELLPFGVSVWIEHVEMDNSATAGTLSWEWEHSAAG